VAPGAGAVPGGPVGTGTVTALGAHAAAAAIRRGELTSERLVRACLEQIERHEPTVGAWTFLDPAHALQQARAADAQRARGGDLGPLHGVPVGVKDIFDTADMPTENGTVLHAGRRPAEDATAVALLRAAGAVILGKTVTTELAVFGPGKTRNPRDPRRTPGGSSSGSAAAISADMVPLAIGTQTNGSVIRPAAYCGVFGYKPSHGLISRRGVLRQCRHFDQVGVFARSVEDLALVAEPLMAFDAADPAMRPRARPGLLAALEPPTPSPRLGFVRSPYWDRADPDARAAFESLRRALGDAAEDVELPAILAESAALHPLVLEPDLAAAYAAEYERGADLLSPVLRAMIERGQRVLATDHIRAVERLPALGRALGEVLARFDALVTPATTGEAPLGLESTGSPIFCTIWTVCGVPAVTVPLLQGASGMPLGVQVVGAMLQDARTLRAAQWLATRGAAAG
jgi:Asp-tRNA(Asn)/Glu-tRNA(Gln) amidotransferase A subunit family amidase